MKIMAIGTVDHPLTVEEQEMYLPQEVPDTLQLYLDGKMEQFWLRENAVGVIFLLSVATVAEAEQILGTLPLVRANLLSFELLPIGPLMPLARLLSNK